MMRTAKIYFQDNQFESTVGVVKFLSSSLERLVMHAGIHLDLQIVEASDGPALRAEGIREFPAMIISGVKISGANNIRDFLTKEMRTKKTAPPLKTNEESVHDFMMSEMRKIKIGKDGKPIDEPEDDEEGTGDVQRKIADMAQRRSVVRKGPGGMREGMRDSMQDHEEGMRGDMRGEEHGDMRGNRGMRGEDTPQRTERPRKSKRPSNVSEPSIVDSFKGLTAEDADGAQDDIRLMKMFESQTDSMG